MLTLAIAAAIAITLAWLAIWMFSQKPVTSAQKLIQQHRYEEAIAAARADDHLHRAEALKLLGRFDEAIVEYRKSDDPAALEGIALSLVHAGGNLDEAKRLMDETIALHPQIQEFQALALAYVLLKRGERDEALRLFDDNLVLLQTRFRDDYTDPDPLLAETLWMFAQLSNAAGDVDRAEELRAQARAWAPGSIWAR